MTTIQIFSGFLGAGKTTLLKKLIKEVYTGEKLVLIENEFGEIGIDGGFMQEAGIQVNELNSGCICCSLVGDFREALLQVIDTYAPDRILIEPSGVGKLSDIIQAVSAVTDEQVQMGAFVTVVDAGKCKLYMKNFGEFYNDQVENAPAIVMSRTQNLSDEKIAAAVALLREHNPTATIVTTPWEQLTGTQIAQAINGGADMAQAMMDELHQHHHHHELDEHCECGCHDHEHHHHHHHEHDEHCECGCHGHDHEHAHHHHEHDEHCECGCHGHDHEHEHHHHHEHDEHCECGCHDHEHHHHHHHADEVFTSWGRETTRRYTAEEVSAMLTALDGDDYGSVLRAKGILPAVDGSWIHFDYVPFEQEVRTGTADYTGRLCVIGANLNEAALAKLFCVE